MNILALDCGSSTGFSTLINGSIRSGVERMVRRTNESAGMKYLRFDTWLIEIHGLGNFNLIVYEKPHGLKGNAVESMNGYITGIHRFISHRENTSNQRIEYQAVSPQTIKKWATGNGRASKQDMIDWFLNIEGRLPIGDDEADAMALLYFICSELSIEINP